MRELFGKRIPFLFFAKLRNFILEEVCSMLLMNDVNIYIPIMKTTPPKGRCHNSNCLKEQ